jgi:hypothetical protein
LITEFSTAGSAGEAIGRRPPKRTNEFSIFADSDMHPKITRYDNDDDHDADNVENAHGLYPLG